MPRHRCRSCGATTTITRQHAWFRSAIDDSYNTGYQDGLDAREHIDRAELRVEIERELRDEGLEPDCDLCAARSELRHLRADLAATKIARDDERARSRGWLIRDGRPFPYRETKKPGL